MVMSSWGRFSFGHFCPFGVTFKINCEKLVKNKKSIAYILKLCYTFFAMCKKHMGVRYYTKIK